jgi:hypothetical protein
MEKELLVKTIRDWVRLDNEIRDLQKEVAKRKTDKKDLSAGLIEIMRASKLDCVDIKGGKITYNKKSVKKPITKKILLNILHSYYKEDEGKAIELNNFILENREVVQKETIARIINEP